MAKTRNDKMKSACIVISAASSYLPLVAFKALFNITGTTAPADGVAFSGYNIILVCLFFFSCSILFDYLYNYFDISRSQKIVSFVLGTLMSVLLVFGTYAHFVNNIFINSETSFLQFKTILELLIFMVPAFNYLYSRICTITKQLALMNTTSFGFIEKAKKRELLYFVLCWLFVFFNYLPVFLTNWPGNFIFDAKYQIRDYLEGSISTHHPIAHTLLMGKTYGLGLKMGNASNGFQVYTIIQMLILSMAFAYLLLFMYENKAPRLVRGFTLAWCALFPLNQVFSITATKDVLCAAFFLAFIVTLARITVNDSLKVNCYLLVLSGTLTSLFRNNMLYAIFIGGIIITLIQKEWKKKALMLGLFTLILLLTKGSNRLMLDLNNGKEVDTYRESLSVPLQCIARVGAYRRNDLEDSVYNETCLYIDPANISYYNPYLADVVKNDANEFLLKSNFVNFMKLFAKIGIKFPDEYVEAIVTNTLGYWYPFYMGKYVSQNLNIYHTLISDVANKNTFFLEIEKKDFLHGFISDYYYRLFYLDNYTDTPLLGFFMRCCFYVWLLLFALGQAVITRSKKLIVVTIIPLTYLATCLLGPIVSIRYTYPLVVLAPMLIFLLFGHSRMDRSIE